MKNNINPYETDRAAAFDLWMNAPNPMVTLVKTFDVTKLVRLSRKKQLKFNMLLCCCIGKAASEIKEFYTLPVGNGLIRYDGLAVCTIVKNRNGGINSCDIKVSKDIMQFNEEYYASTLQAADNCIDIDLSNEYMVIGTSALIKTEIDSAVGMNSGVYNNPFLIWGKYRKHFLKYTLPVSFQFHHTQMDGMQAGHFLEKLQKEINSIRG